MRPPRDIVLIVALILGLPWAAARADGAPSWFATELTPRLRFDNLDDYPDYSFYLAYGRTGGAPTYRTLTQVEPGATVLLEGSGRRMVPVILIAVPRGKEMPSLKELVDLKARQVVKQLPG